RPAGSRAGARAQRRLRTGGDRPVNHLDVFPACSACRCRADRAPAAFRLAVPGASWSDRCVGMSASTPSAARRDVRGVISWALWDWGSAAFNTVILTFVFTVYLTQCVAADPRSGSQSLGVALTVAGVGIALVA